MDPFSISLPSTDQHYKKSLKSFQQLSLKKLKISCIDFDKKGKSQYLPPGDHTHGIKRKAANTPTRTVEGVKIEDLHINFNEEGQISNTCPSRSAYRRSDILGTKPANRSDILKGLASSSVSATTASTNGVYLNPMYHNHPHLTPTSPRLILISQKNCESSLQRFSVSLRPTAGSPGLSHSTLTHT